MARNRVAQPANFVLQVGLVSLLRTLGVPCHGVLGHSVGSLRQRGPRDALSLDRAALVAYQRAGFSRSWLEKGHARAGIGAADASSLLREIGGVTIASYNSPKSVTFAGERAALELLAERLEHMQAFTG